MTDEGYLLSKCVTARSRAADKDYYDFVYVLSYNRAGGPEQAARALRGGQFADDLGSLRSTFLELRETLQSTGRFRPERVRSTGVAGGSRGVGAQPRADAVDRCPALYRGTQRVTARLLGGSPTLPRFACHSLA